MSVVGKDREFRHPGISYLDYKALEMDRVLTAFLARLWHRGLPSRLRRNRELTVQNFVQLIHEYSQGFEGFDTDTTERWATTHLLDLVSRGRAAEKVAGPRPLHGFAYRFRNARQSRPYGADEQLYTMLEHSKFGDYVLSRLRGFFFPGVESGTGRITSDVTTDVETQALLHLVAQAEGHIADTPNDQAPHRVYPPLCPQPENLLAEDVLKLLQHEQQIPRSVLVDYLKLLFAFHLALYHLRMMKLLPAAVAMGRLDAGCATGHQGDAARCAYQPLVFADLTGLSGSGPAQLAAHSAEAWYRRIPEFIQASYTIKKLDDLAEYLVGRGRFSYVGGRRYFAAAELLPLLGTGYEEEREAYAKARLAGILGSVKPEDQPAEVRQITSFGLPEFTVYIELLQYYRGANRRGYFTDCLDSMLLRNRPGALLAGTRGKQGVRRFALDSRLLEVLLQICLLQPDGGGGFSTAALRVDEFLALLRERYGLYVDRLPRADGFTGDQLDDQAALRENRAAFIHRLREIGYYQDMSDAYLTQTITPRYHVPATLPVSGSAR
ncbi:methylation-associated defense system protein MAD7 [Streptomyces gibsoniae]|uniref:Uncharacterized protein n=1 Tax=Streptomyces gibsoniae TaxID=3075529 RepID=A0ABU2U680_9ACTN|nr:hypothetical protein [Streptomyces sp. DSM 41699]MDT0468734.1 hypothetical protein [Streptomyces sp. DSM 41699]